ncbi:MAG: hypothetical protein ABWZ64_12590 [Xanthobacteraceae bacterium]|jgi:hypothetical protein
MTGGAVVTGIYAACTSIVAFANPLIFGFFNILTPRFVRTLRSEGLLALRRQAARDALVLGAVMATFFVLVLLFGDELMQLLYPGSEYRGNGHTLVVLAAASMVAAIGAPAAVALMTAEHARAVALIAAGTAAHLHSRMGADVEVGPCWRSLCAPHRRDCRKSGPLDGLHGRGGAFPGTARAHITKLGEAK